MTSAVKQEASKRPIKWGVWVLFASLPTLICCALPILLVSLGMGSVIAAVYGDYLPFLGWFGLNKEITFGISGAILIGSGWLLFKSGKHCPTDPELAAICANTQKWNTKVYWVSLSIWLISAFTAFFLPLLVY